MKSVLIFAAMALFSAPNSSSSSADFIADTNTVIRGEMRVDKIYDYNNEVVCYLGQHNNGSSHTTPALFCLKFK